MIALILGLVLSFVHYISGSFRLFYPKNEIKVVSFTLGMFVTYLFMHLFPMLYTTTAIEISMLSVLLGFSLFNIIEKYIYKTFGEPTILKRKMKEVHSISFFMYHLIIGMLLVKLLHIGFTETMLFFVPIVFLTSISSMSLKSLYVSKDMQAKVLLSISPFIGVVFAMIITIPEIIFNLLLGFMVGTLLYTIMIDALPKEKEGEPIFFVFGLLIYLLIIMLTWFV